MQYKVAPLQPTQEAMNYYFQGAVWEIAERYTDMIKTLFVGLFWAALVPQSLIVTTIAMFTTFLCDKYSLFYLWRRIPQIDDQLARRSRQIMVFVVLVHVVASHYFLVNWPFDLPKDERPECDEFVVLECETKDMSSSQKKMNTVYDALTYILLLLFGIYVLGNRIFDCVMKLFCGQVSELSEDQYIPYRDVVGITPYVPQVPALGIVDNLFGCRVAEENIPLHYLPARHNIDGTEIDREKLSLVSTDDVPSARVAGDDAKTDENLDQLFGLVKFYPRPASDAPPALPKLINPGDIAAQVGQAANTAANFVSNVASNVAGVASDVAGAVPMPANPMANIMQTTATLRPAMARGTSGMLAPLPAGWEERQGPDGRVYYVDHNTQTTQWERPKAKTQRAVDLLPPGWEQKITPQGKVYFVDHINKKTTWERPAPVDRTSLGLSNRSFSGP